MMDSMYYLPINGKTGLKLSMEYVKETIDVTRLLKELKRRGEQQGPHTNAKL